MIRPLNYYIIGEVRTISKMDFYKGSNLRHQHGDVHIDAAYHLLSFMPKTQRVHNACKITLCTNMYILVLSPSKSTISTHILIIVDTSC